MKRIIKQVEIFVTSVQHAMDAGQISKRLLELFPSYKVTFDLDDCDRILRVEIPDGSINRPAIRQLVLASGHHCEVLPD